MKTVDDYIASIKRGRPDLFMPGVSVKIKCTELERIIKLAYLRGSLDATESVHHESAIPDYPPGFEALFSGFKK